MDDFSENEFLLLLAVKSIKGEKISHLPEGLDYSALFQRRPVPECSRPL